MPASKQLLWIDAHIHVSDISPGGEHRDNLLQDILTVLDKADADLRFVISCDFPYMTNMKTQPHSILPANRMIHELAGAAPRRLYGSCTINPNFLDESLHVMDVCFGEWGFVQLGEMLQYLMDYQMDSPATEKAVRKAVKFDVPVQVHLSISNRGPDGSTWGMDQLNDLFPLIERVPEARYILAHAVGEMNADPPVVNQYLDAIEKRFGHWPENVWMEIRDACSPGVRSALARVPSNMIIMGTDWTTRVGPPFLSYGTIFNVKSAGENLFPPCVQSMIDLLLATGASEEDIRRIASRNALELYRLRT